MVVTPWNDAGGSFRMLKGLRDIFVREVEVAIALMIFPRSDAYWGADA